MFSQRSYYLHYQTSYISRNYSKDPEVMDDYAKNPSKLLVNMILRSIQVYTPKKVLTTITPICNGCYSN